MKKHNNIDNVYADSGVNFLVVVVLVHRQQVILQKFIRLKVISIVLKRLVPFSSRDECTAKAQEQSAAAYSCDPADPPPPAE